MEPVLFETMADGLVFPEGPVVLADGSVLFVQLGTGALSRFTSEHGVGTVAELGGGPNGVAIGPDGHAYVCNNGGSYACALVDGVLQFRLAPERYVGGAIQRVDLTTGAVETLYTHCEGRPLQAPNDLVFDATGGFWFTDFGRAIEGGLLYGGLYYAASDGSAIRRARADLLSPNGIGLSPDERWLYWADSYTGRVWRCAVAAPGRLVDADAPLPGQVVATLPGYQLLDSLAVEESGRICVATIANGGISVFRPDGFDSHVPIDDPQVTNLCFAGDDMRTVWVTAAGTGRLLRGRWPRPGARLAFTR